MKRMVKIAVFGLIVLSSLSYSTTPAYSQESFAGNWEGMFMDDFRTLIKLERDTLQNFSGRILMYDGEKQIQDDELFKISIQENKLTFYIMAKETHYKGELNSSTGELTGIFIFPDNSEHPLSLIKSVTKKNE